MHIIYTALYILAGFIIAYYIRNEEEIKEGAPIKRVVATVILWPAILVVAFVTSKFWNKKVKL